MTSLRLHQPVEPYSMWVPRKPGAELPSCSWKVTARFDLQLPGRGPRPRRIECVRVHGFYGLGIVLHYEKAEFLRLFRRADDKDQIHMIRYNGNVLRRGGRRGYGTIAR